MSGAIDHIVKNPPSNIDPKYTIITIKGTPEQVRLCKQLIQALVDRTIRVEDLYSQNFDIAGKVWAGSYKPLL